MSHCISWYPACLRLSSGCVHQPHPGSAVQHHLIPGQVDPFRLAISYLILLDSTPELFCVTVNKPKAKGSEVDYSWPIPSPDLT